MPIFTNKLTLTTLIASLICASAHAETTTKISSTGGVTVNIQPSAQGTNKFTQTTTLSQTQTISYAAQNLANSSYTSSNQSTSAFTSSNWSSYSSDTSNRNQYDHLIRDAAARHGVDPALIKAIIHTESTFKSNARSRVGAMGLMQLMPGTAREMGVYNAYDPAQNIEGGTKYIALLQTMFSNPNHVIAAYNAGPGNVRKHGGIPPFRETRNYVQKVNERYNNIYSLDASLYQGFNGSRTALAMNTSGNAGTSRISQTVIGDHNYATPQNPNINPDGGRFFISSRDD